MQVNVTMTQESIMVGINGISITLTPGKVKEGITNLGLFLKAVAPENMINDKDMLSFIDKSNQIAEVIERGFNLFKIDESIHLVTTLDPNGDLNMESSGGCYTLDFKGYLNLMHQISTGSLFNTKPEEEHRKKDGQVTTINMNIKNPTVRDLLDSTENYPVLNREARLVLRNSALESFLYSYQLEHFNKAIRKYHVRYIANAKKEESTDQGMIDNEIEFNSRPTVIQVLEAINASTRSEDITWTEFYDKMEEEHGYILKASAHASTTTCIQACDIYGFIAICNFNVS